MVVYFGIYCKYEEQEQDICGHIILEIKADPLCSNHNILSTVETVAVWFPPLVWPRVRFYCSIVSFFLERSRHADSKGHCGMLLLFTATPSAQEKKSTIRSVRHMA
jgi:hypothetical protein